MDTNNPDMKSGIIRKSVLALALFALIGTALVALTNHYTRDRIVQNEREYLLRGLNELISPDRYDNDLFTDVVTVINKELLGTSEPVTIYRARREGSPVAAILTPVVPNGYSGPIGLLVGINYDGGLIGVRVSSHRETPGLGDKIDIGKGDWIFSFDGLRIGNPPASQWTVKKEGGYFDQFTGATVTPRAVVIAVYNALLYLDDNRDLIFSELAQQTPQQNMTDDS